MKKGKMIVVMAIVLLCAMTMLAGCGSKVDAFDYLDPSFDGYNGNGTVSIDGEDFLVEAVIGSEPEDPTKFGEWILTYDDLYGNVDVQCEPSSNLSNGDTVTVTVTVTGSAEKEIAGGKKEFEVSGLDEVQTVDLFADVELEFTGIVGDITGVKLNWPSDNDILNACEFDFKPDNDFKNDDVITVTITNSDYLAKNYLVVPAELSKTFTVSGLDEYLTDPDMLPKDQIREIIDRYVVDSQKIDEDFWSYGDSTYYNTYFCLEKEGVIGADFNRLYIYVCYDAYMDGNYRRTIYTPLTFRNLILAADGTIELNYEDGENAVFQSDPEAVDAYMEEQYIVEEITIEY